MTADHHVHPVVMFVGRHCIYELERETYTYFICIPLPVFTLFIEAFSAFTLFIDAPLSGSVQKAVVISLSSAEAVAVLVESHSRKTSSKLALTPLD